MENKFVEFIENNKKVIISSVAVGVVLVLGFGWYSYNQQQAEQQAKIVQLEKDSKSDKEQVDKLFESFDASSDESISKLKELSETSLKTDAGKDYLNNKVKESSKAIVDFHLQKGLAYDVKDSDDKFKDKATLETNVKEITKQIDFIKKVDETFKQENLEETLKSLNDLVDKYQKQIELLKKEEEKAKESSSQSNSSGSASNESYNGSSNSNVDYSSSEQTNGYSNNYGGQDYSGSGDSSTNGGSSEQYSSSNSNSGANNVYRYKGTGADGYQRYYYKDHNNGDVYDDDGNYLGNFGGGIAEPSQR
ncbi:TPA: hypothetical protein ACOYUM_000946 [Streptococcus pneumoniae]